MIRHTVIAIVAALLLFASVIALAWFGAAAGWHDTDAGRAIVENSNPESE